MRAAKMLSARSAKSISLYEKQVMKFTSLFTSTPPAIDVLLSAVIVVFLVYPVPMPALVARWIDSPPGVAVVVVAAFYLFFRASTVLGVLSLIAAYELLRRSSASAGRYASNEFLYGTPGASLPSERLRTQEMRTMNSAGEDGVAASSGLEEEIIRRAAPVGRAPPGQMRAGASAANVEVDGGGGGSASFQPVLDSGPVAALASSV